MTDVSNPFYTIFPNRCKTRLKYWSHSHLNLKLRWNFGLNVRMRP
jgi:hypothetical protein